MTAPSYQDSAETAVWDSTTTPRSTGSLTAAVNDVIVCLAANEDSSSGNNLSSSGSGVSLSILEETSGASMCELDVRAGVVASSGTVSASIAFGGGTGRRFGGAILRFNGSDGIGASGQIATPTDATSASFSVTTTQDNSALTFIFADYNAVDPATISESFDTINGASPTVIATPYVSTAYTVYFGYFADVGAAGSKTVTFRTNSATTVKMSAAAVEVKGTAGGSPTYAPSNTVRPRILTPFATARTQF